MRPTRLSRPAIAGLTLVACIAAACGNAPASASPTPVEITAAPTLAPTPVPSVEPSSATASGTPDASAGAVIHGTTGEIVNETDGYAITLPDGWLRLDLSADDLSAVMESAAGMSDDLATMMQSQAATMAMAGVHFWAIKTGEMDDGFASNANIIRQPSIGVGLDMIEQLSVNQLESLDMLGGRKVAHDRVTLPAGEAIHLRYQVAAKDASAADITATIVQYLIVHDDGQFILTVTGPDGEQAAAEAAAMAESWTFAS
jgi:hypothetical protein